MELWKKIRLSRIFSNDSWRTIIVPMDHHGTSIAPIKWIEDPADLIKKISKWGANAILSHIWTITHWYSKSWIWSWTSAILHMNVTTWLSPNPSKKVVVNNLKTALKLWVDAVSFHVNLWDEKENEMIQELWILANECIEWWMPLIAMMFVRGKNFDEKDVELIRWSARIAAEFGCDAVKVPYTWDIESMKKVVEATPIPVLIAWGSKMSDEETLKMIKGAIKAWCAWICVWRNIFQRKNPEKFLKIISDIVHTEKK